MEMMKFNSEECGVSDKEIKDIAALLAPYMATLAAKANDARYETPESFLHFPRDEAMRHTIESAAQQFRSDSLRYILVVGIGGSALGAQAIYHALFGYADAVSPARYPKMIFVDTVDPEFNRHLEHFLKNDIVALDELAIVIATKSGTTVETVNNAKLVVLALAKRFSGIEKRISSITDKGVSVESLIGVKSVAIHLEIPKHVGGRFSVFSAMGLFPLALAGIDIAALCEGARSADQLLREADNAIARSSAITFAHYQKGVKIHNSFFFHPEFEFLGGWWRQLIGESLGKEHEGKSEGIIPEVSIGSADLHSVGQMYLAGTQSALTTFVFAESVLRADNTGKILHAILEGVKRAYEDKRMPFVELVLPDIFERALGEYMQFKMIETVLLAHLIGINAFDQPNVEAYKAHMRKVLGD